jgi:hypothetical protein
VDDLAVSHRSVPPLTLLDGRHREVQESTPGHDGPIASAIGYARRKGASSRVTPFNDSAVGYISHRDAAGPKFSALGLALAVSCAVADVLLSLTRRRRLRFRPEDLRGCGNNRVWKEKRRRAEASLCLTGKARWRRVCRRPARGETEARYENLVAHRCERVPLWNQLRQAGLKGTTLL